MSVQRFLLILGVCCALFVALALPGTAFAHTTTHNTTQQQVAATSQSEYWFYAGWAGWGYCFNHDTIQSLDKGFGHVPSAILAFTSVRFGWTSAVAVAAIEGIHWYLESIDQGQGDCIAFAGGSPAFPLAWARR